VFASNVSMCLHHLAPSAVMDSTDSGAHLTGGNALTVSSQPAPSLVITRNLYQTVGIQHYLPSRYTIILY
jgi:hypothetical protein